MAFLTSSGQALIESSDWLILSTTVLAASPGTRHSPSVTMALGLDRLSSVLGVALGETLVLEVAVRGTSSRLPLQLVKQIAINSTAIENVVFMVPLSNLKTMPTGNVCQWRCGCLLLNSYVKESNLTPELTRAER